MATTSAVAGMPTLAVGIGEVWLPYVEILEEIEKAVETPTTDSLEDLERSLNMHQAQFRSLLTTKAKNPKEREHIKAGVSEPVAIKGAEGKQILPGAWVAEALLLSDVLDINEVQALDLIVTGESEVLNYPCWSRGLIAVNMYYEGQHCLISALHTMVRLSPGLTWGSRVSHKVLDVVKSFLATLYADNLVDKIIELLPRFDVQKQMDILDSNLALGDWRHRTEIMKHLSAIRVELAQIIFCLAAQERMSWKNTLRILEYLKHIQLKPNVKFYKEHILLIMSVIYGLDNNLSGENFDKSYGVEFRKYVVDAVSKKHFLCYELLDFLNFAYHTCVYKLLSDITIINYSTPLSGGRPAFGKGVDTSSELLGDEELEFRTDVFSFLRIEFFLNSSAEIGEEEHIMRRLHGIFVDFINHMPMKLKDMKVRSEDAAKTVLLYLEQGVSHPPHLPVEYESFLECMGAFYSLDKELQLAESFFSPDRNSLSLSKFTRSLCYDSPPMFVCNTRLMTGLGSSFPTGVFTLVKQDGHNLSLEHFFESIMKYLASFGKPASTTGPVFESDAYQRVVVDSMKSCLSPHEANGIIVYLQLIQSICADPSIKSYFVDTKRHWIKLSLMSTKIRSLPREIRAEMLKAVASMIPTENISHEAVVALWDILYSCRLIDPGSADFRNELEENETRLESYVLCNGFLSLFDALVKARVLVHQDFGSDESIFYGDSELLGHYVSYVRDSVLLKMGYRTYRSVTERWETSTLSISIISRLLDSVPLLMVQFLSDSPVLKAVLGVLVECTKVREMSTGKIPHVDKTSWEVLNLIYQVVLRQDSFMRKSATSVRGAILFGIHDLLVSISIKTGRPEYLFALLKFIDKFNPEKHQDLSLQILTTILSEHSETDAHVYAGITSDQRLAVTLEYTFSQCLTNPSCSLNIKKKILKLLRCSVVHSAPNLGLFLLGVDKRMDFQKTGLDDMRPSKTILHYILQNCDELPDVFLTLLVILQDERLRDSLLRYLRVNKFFVNYYVDQFSPAEMDLKDTGYFLKCLAIELKNAQMVGPLAHVLVSQNSNKFLSVLDRIELSLEEVQLPMLEFFEKELVTVAIAGCEYMDRDFKVKLVDLKRLEDLFEEQINKLEKSTALKLKKSVTGEAKELLAYANSLNEIRRREASKVILFDSWKQCLEVLILTPWTLKLGRMDFVTSVLRLIVDKVTNTERATEAFFRLAAEAVLSLCGVLHTFKEELSESMLNLVLTYLCAWAAQETSAGVRAFLYPSILNIMGIMKDQKKNVTSRTNFAIIIDDLCKDCLHSVDTGKITSMYLLGEIIHWSMQSGFGGRVPYFDPAQPITFGPNATTAATHNTSISAAKTFMSGDGSMIADEEPRGKDGLGWQDISIIAPPPQDVYYMDSPRAPKLSDSSFSHQLNSTVLPGAQPDAREAQYIFPGEWQGIEKDTSFFAFQQKDSDKVFEIEEGLMETAVLATQTTVMSYMQAKGFVHHLISSLTNEDDLGLLDLFSSPTESTYLRALLIFGARMHMFSRLARTGPNSALILLEANIIPRLTDMQSFKVAARSEVWYSNSQTNDEDDEMIGEIRMNSSSPTERASQLDSFFTSVLTFLHSMSGSLPKNSSLALQIWRFLSVNQTCCVNLLSRCPTSSDQEVPEPLALLTSLLAKICDKIPGDTIQAKNDIYDKVITVLNQMCRKVKLTNAQAHVVRDLLYFLHKHATNPSNLRKEDSDWPYRVILLSSMKYRGIEEARDGLSIGAVFRLVQLAAQRMHNWDGTPEVLTMMINICEIGLVMAYWHLEIYMSVPKSVREEERRRQERLKGKTSEAEDVQNTLAVFLEEAAERVLAIAFELHGDSATKNYIQTLLSRLRRLAYLKK